MEETRTWWKEGVIYQIYPRSFMDSNGDGVGDLNGIRQRLPYLARLGVSILWLSPFYKSPQDDNGYDISDYFSVDPLFGAMEDFDALLREAHALGLRVIVDMVVNHTSDEHPWFLESRKGRENPYRDYYIWRPGRAGGPPNNWESWFSGSAWERDEASGEYYLHLFSRRQPDLNWENPAVREAIYRMLDWWCQKGVDGFRLDTISLLSKAPGLPDGVVPPGGAYGDAGPHTAHGPRIHEFLQEMNRRVFSRYDITTVGETSLVTTEQAKLYCGFSRKELDMVFHFERHDLENESGSKWTDRRPSLPAVKEVFARWQDALEGVAWNSLYWENHDQPRSVSRYGDESPEYWALSAKLLAVALHFQKGTVNIYQGEELGMTNMPFASLADCRDVEARNAYHALVDSGRVSHADMMRRICRMSRDNARTPMQWSAGPNAGFTTGTPWIAVNPNHTWLNAEAQLEDPASVYHFYRRLLRLRRENPIMVYGTFAHLCPAHAQLFAYTRTLGAQQLLVMCNFSRETVRWEIPAAFARAEQFLCNYDSPAAPAAPLRPWEARVLRIA